MTMQDLLGSAGPPPMVGLVRAFGSVLPAEVRQVMAEAEQGAGPARFWLAGDRGVSLVECGRMLNEPRLSVEVVGWILAITMFAVREQQVPPMVTALTRTTFRDEIIPIVIDALAAGIVDAKLDPGPRLWTSIEHLVSKIGATNVPRRLLDALPLGLCSPLAVVRGCALRLATELGDAAVVAIERAAERSPNRALHAALSTLSGGDQRQASHASEDAVALLRELLVAWRECRDVELEKPILRIGAEVARGRGPIEAGSRSELEGAWHAVAKQHDPCDVNRLLDCPWPATWKRARDRVDALAGFDADPRIANRLVELARSYSSSGSLPLHRRINSAIIKSATPTLIPSLDAIAAGPAPVLGRAYIGVREKIGELLPHPAESALLARANAGQRNDVEALYAQVAANPGDIEIRAVLADALQLVGDPRGELIALQLAIAEGTASPGAKRRAAALLATHGATWMGPLPGVDSSTRRFERGFLSAVTTGASSLALARSVDRPEWATVEELTVTEHTADLAPVVGRLPVLRRLCAERSALERLAGQRACPGVQTVFVRGIWIPPAHAFPDLAVLGITAFRGNFGFEALVRFQREAAARGLRAIVHVGASNAATLISARTAGPAETLLTLSTGPTTFDPPGWRVRVHRDSAVAEAAWVYPRYEAYKTPELFEPLAAAGIKQVAVWFPEGLADWRDRLIGERPFGLDLVPGEAIDLTT